MFGGCIIVRGSVQVVSLVSPSGDLVGDRVGFTVEFTVNWWKTNHGALSSFNHGHPDDKSPHDDTSGGRVDVTGELGVSSSDQSQDNDDGEDQKEKTEYNTDPVQRSVNSMGLVVGRHVDKSIDILSVVESICFGFEVVASSKL